MGRARACARRQPRLLPVFECARRGDGAGEFDDQRPRRPGRQEDRHRRRTTRQELAAAAGSGAAIGRRSENAGADRLWRTAASDPEGAAGRDRRHADVLEFLRRARGQGHEPRGRHGRRREATRRQGSRGDGRLRIRRRLGATQSRAARSLLCRHAAGEKILAESPAEWQRLAPRIGVNGADALEIYRRRYLEGIPHRPLADEAADAQALYRVLAEIGGAELVGPATALDPGTFYSARPNE